jgi:hypothetical protein
MKEKHNLINCDTTTLYEILDEIEQLKKLRKKVQSLEQTLKMTPVYRKEPLLRTNQKLNDFIPTPSCRNLLVSYNDYLNEYRALRKKIIVHLKEEVEDIERCVLENIQGPEKNKQLKYSPSYQNPKANLKYQFFKTAKACYTSPLINQEQIGQLKAFLPIELPSLC